MTFSQRWIAAGATFLALGLLATAASAQDVLLQSRDGGIAVSGTLLSYDGEFYWIDSEFGELTLDAQALECSGPGCPDLLTFVPEVIVAGSRTLTEGVFPQLLGAFATESGLVAQSLTEDGRTVKTLAHTPDGRALARFVIEHSDSQSGLDALRSGAADIALSVIALREPGYRLRAIALDAFVPVVGRDNPLDGLSLADLTAILAGGITSWADLGGPDLPIRVHLRDEGSAVQRALEAQMLGPLGLRARPDAARHLSDRALARAVAADPLGIALVLRSVAGAARTIPFRGRCGLVHAATPLAVKAGDYPLVLPLLVHTRAERLPLQARRFLSFLSGDTAQRVVADAGFIDQTTERVGLAEQGLRLANAISAAGEETPLSELQRLVDAMQGAARLSPTFRFDTGLRTLSTQSETNIAYLAEALEAGRYAGRELVFVGFTDGDGPAETNLRLARDRAEAVRRAVLAAAPLFDQETTALSVDAFGEAMPMECDDTEAGRQVNRRVEVWLR